MPAGEDSEAYPGAVPQPQTIYPFPTEEFDPTKFVEVMGWAHDATVQPGKTYRYKVVYKLKNPIFLTGNVAKNPQLAEQFQIVSKESEWTEEVIIPNATNFYLAQPPRPDWARFEIFVWKNGQQQSKTFEVAPGDPIGKVDGAIDYSTGWSLVDVREDPRSNGDRYVIVMDPNGSLVKRDFKVDREDADYKQHKEAVSANAAASANGRAAGDLP